MINISPVRSTEWLLLIDSISIKFLSPPLKKKQQKKTILFQFSINQFFFFGCVFAAGSQRLQHCSDQPHSGEAGRHIQSHLWVSAWFLKHCHPLFFFSFHLWCVFQIEMCTSVWTEMSVNDAQSHTIYPIMAPWCRVWISYSKNNSGFACVCVSSASKYGVETKTIAADFGSLDIYSDIENKLKGLEIGILGKWVCNLGADIHRQVKVQVRNTTEAAMTGFTRCCEFVQAFRSSLLPSEDWKLNNMLSAALLKKEKKKSFSTLWCISHFFTDIFSSLCS